MKKNVLIINGSLGGANGNTAQVLHRLEETLRTRCSVSRLDLAVGRWREEIEASLEEANGLVFATGTYWDSWGSPLQIFFEEMTDHEASSAWLGKPAAAIVTMHSVGGKEVLSRLQGVLSTLGMMIPPMSGFAYSLAGHLALQTPPNEFHSDIWQLDDVKIIASNLVRAMELVNGQNESFTPWPIDSSDPYRRWL